MSSFNKEERKYSPLRREYSPLRSFKKHMETIKAAQIAAEQAEAKKWYLGKYGKVIGDTIFNMTGKLFTPNTSNNSIVSDTLPGVTPNTGNNLTRTRSSSASRRNTQANTVNNSATQSTSNNPTIDKQKDREKAIKEEESITKNYNNNYKRLIDPLLKNIVITDTAETDQKLPDETINIPDNQDPRNNYLIKLKNAVFNRLYNENPQKKYRIVYVHTTKSKVYSNHSFPSGDVDIKEITHKYGTDYTADGPITTRVPLSLLILDNEAKEQNRIEVEKANQDIFKKKRIENRNMSRTQTHRLAAANPNYPIKVPLRDNTLNAGGNRKTKSRRQHKRKSSKRR
jgi:hypothetical protein